MKRSKGGKIFENKTKRCRAIFLFFCCSALKDFCSLIRDNLETFFVTGFLLS